MNQHVQLLVQQAQSLTDKFQEQWKAGPSTEEFFHEKFAELIVRECIRKIEDIAESSNNPQPIYRVAVELLEHFGVEE